jgi:hypothetical protein
VSEPRSILLLCDESRRHAANVLQHIEALATLSEHDVYRFNPIDRPDACRLLDLDEFDAVVLHYTIALTSASYLPPPLPERIRVFRGLKLQFIQDEYRAVDAVTAAMRALEIDVLFTCAPEPAARRIYAPRLPGVTTITTLPGYVPDELVGRAVPAVEERPIDVGYKGRDVPVWLGRLAREKTEIASGFVEHARRYGLNCDISSREEDRIYGESWNRFLSSCRATLGTESGASIVDFDGSLAARGKDYLARYPHATLAEIERDLTRAHEGNVVINTASPRLFEAAALRTAMVLFPGDYSGVVAPWEHYVPLEKDFSNIEAVVERIRDTGFLEELVARTYDDLIASGRYSLHALVREFDSVVAERSQTMAQSKKRGFRAARRRRAIPSWRQLSHVRRGVSLALRPFVGFLLIASDGPLRRAARAAVASTNARRAGAAGDLWRLTALRYGTTRGTFHVEAELDEDAGVLFLSSRPGSGIEAQRRTQPRPQIEALSEIVWNHSRVGVAAGLAGGTLLAIPIGYHGVEGAHSFRSLAVLSREKPGVVLEALAPFMQRAATKDAVVAVET